MNNLPVVEVHLSLNRYPYVINNPKGDDEAARLAKEAAEKTQREAAEKAQKETANKAQREATEKAKSNSSQGPGNVRNADALYPGSGVPSHELRYNTGMLGQNPGNSSIKITSRVKEHDALLKEARKLSSTESQGINSLFEQIRKGNMNPGIGTKVFDGITEFRHRSGGRLYAKVNGSTVEVLGYSGKGNQSKVIDLIKSTFR